MIESVEESKRIDDLMQQNFKQINEKLTKLSINMEYIKKSDIKTAVFAANDALQGNADPLMHRKMFQFIPCLRNLSPQIVNDSYLPKCSFKISDLEKYLRTCSQSRFACVIIWPNLSAKSLFESAYELAPGHSTTLGLLEHVSVLLGNKLDQALD